MTKILSNIDSITGKEEATVFAVGDVVNEKWVILEFIGKGAMGEVYRAHQLNLQRDVAIKVISAELIESCDDAKAEAENAFLRFQREVQAMARIRHPNVLQIFDHGSIAGSTDQKFPVEFIVMEYIPGDTLRFTMSEEGFYPEGNLITSWLREYFLPLLSGVKAIHAHDVVHRDLKPENILLDGTIPKIADFGLARSCRLKPVTQSMDAKGTLHYMSPDHFFDFRRADQRADIYSLGKILCEAIDGKFGNEVIPFRKGSLKNPGPSLFKGLDEIIQKATAENKENRFQSIDDLELSIVSVLEISNQQPISVTKRTEKYSRFADNPKWVWAAVLSAIIAVIAMAVWHLAGEPRLLKNQPLASYINTSIREQTPLSLEDRKSRDVNLNDRRLKSRLLTQDGATLVLIPGATLSRQDLSPGNSFATLELKSFYIDETSVTNHQYVDFLNRNVAKLKVESGVVKKDSDIWLILGEIFQGYEPIIFRNKKFHISNSRYAASPVLRVTAIGASAYTHFYGRRLPTAAEWIQAMTDINSPREQLSKSLEKSNPKNGHASMHAQQPEVSTTQPYKIDGLMPVTNLRANKFGVRLSSPAISEWGIRKPNLTASGKKSGINYILLGAGDQELSSKEQIPSPVTRQPWEAFENVGFRGVQNAGSIFLYNR